MGRRVVALKKIIEVFSKKEVSLEKLKEILQDFHCSKNCDEEQFLHNTAIQYELSDKARTYLIIESNKVIAYFSVAVKSINLQPLNKNRRKKITAGESNSDNYATFLIGHLAKDDSVKYKLGKHILDLALLVIYAAQNLVGGRLVYLDCKDTIELKNFYESNGFTYFNTSQVSQLLQYYKIL